MLSAYADDTTFFVQDIESVNNIFELFHQFSSFSGFKLNHSKCELCGIGALKGVKTALCNVKNVNLEKESIKILGIYYTYNKKVHIEKNFMTVLTKIRNVLNVWKFRNLSLFGKITIFKTLAISSIIFVSHMSSVPREILNSLNDLHCDFIWDGKKRKIKHSTLIGDYHQGGLKDVDVDTKILALQLSWIKRLHDDNFHPWKILPSFLLEKYFSNKSSLFYPNLNFNRTVEFTKLPVFYQNILNSWSLFSKASPSTASSILSECIWQNAFIKIESEPIGPHFLNLCKNIYICDCFDKNGAIIKWEIFKENQDLPNCFYFKWRQLIDAIPKPWVRIIKNDKGDSRKFIDRSPHLLSKARIIPLKKLNSKEFYNINIQSKFATPSSQKSIATLLSDNVLPWKEIYLLAFSTSIDSFSRIFQYKILNNILFLNNTLYKMGKVSSPLCSYCNVEKETISHLFLECKITKRVWSQLQNYFASNLDIPNLNLQSAVVGYLDHPNKLFLNNLLLTFKMVLYKYRNRKAISMNLIVKNMLARKQIEENIAREKNKIEYHDKKWKIFDDILSSN